jgi:hypothetical protein
MRLDSHEEEWKTKWVTPTPHEYIHVEYCPLLFILADKILLTKRGVYISIMNIKTAIWQKSGVASHERHK